MDLVKLLKLKAQYGDVYVADTPSGMVVCRQPTIGELCQLKEIQESKKLSETDQCKLIQRQTLIEGEPTDQYLLALGEQILMDQPADENEYNALCTDMVDNQNVHEQVMIYLASNLNLDISKIKQLDMKSVCLLFGLAKKIEYAIQESQEHTPAQRYTVRPRVE